MIIKCYIAEKLILENDLYTKFQLFLLLCYLLMHNAFDAI